MMDMIDRRRLLVGGTTLLGVTTLAPSALLAAGNPGLTTHMLDVMNGKPAEGVAIDFSVFDGGRLQADQDRHDDRRWSRARAAF